MKYGRMHERVWAIREFPQMDLLEAYAREIQGTHEYDHLNGVLFIDHLPQDEQERVVASYQRKNHKKKKKDRA